MGSDGFEKVLVVLLDERERRRREYFLGICLVSHEKKNKMEKVNGTGQFLSLPAFR